LFILIAMCEIKARIQYEYGFGQIKVIYLQCYRECD
jgi:hypothetical protein